MWTEVIPLIIILVLFKFCVIFIKIYSNKNLEKLTITMNGQFYKLVFEVMIYLFFDYKVCLCIRR